MLGRRHTATINTEQLNAEDMLRGDMLVTVTGVQETSCSKQTMNVFLREWDKPWKPCKTIRNMLITLWGEDEIKWVNRKILLFRDNSVSFGKERNCGGIRVRKMTDLPQQVVEISLKESQKTYKTHRIERLNNYPSVDFDKNKAAWISAIERGAESIESMAKKILDKNMVITIEQESKLCKG